MRGLRWLLYLISAGLIAIAVIRAIPPKRVVIETGPIGGSYYETARKYQALLQLHGVDVELKVNPDSLDIINHVEHGTDGVQVGFTAQRVQRENYPNTVSLGSTEVQPLYIFYSTGLGQVNSLTGLRGRRIVMPPERSATSEAALRVLQDYGVTKANSQISFMPLTEAADALRNGRADAGMFMLASNNALIASMALDDNLEMLSLTDAETLSRLEPYLRPTMLPRRIYSMSVGVPSDDVQLVSATVNVVVNKDLHPAIVYMLLEALAEVHQGPSFVNVAGEFPNMINLSVPAHPLAKEWSKSGTPWMYRDLPLPVAGLIDYYLIIGIALFLLTEFYKTSKYFAELVGLISESMALRTLMAIDRDVRRGRTLSPTQLMMAHVAERMLSKSDKRRRRETLIKRIHAATDPAAAAAAHPQTAE